MSNKKTKIVATLGPATSNKEILKAMLDEGANVFRINFSHADYKDVEERIQMIRELNEEYGYNASILGDLQGPKLRVGTMKGEVIVNEGDEVIFATGKRFEGTKERVYMTYDNFPQDANPGERILLDDGKLIFEVVSTDGKSEVKAKVIQGGPLKSKKGVNLPNTNISQPALTEKDIEDAIFAIGQKVDWIALSFVRHAEDLMQLEELIKEHSDHKIPIIAKIEKPEAVENIDKIVAYCDGLMVARGDLTPTRAEVNDVANSVMDGADAVMLSGETSVGQYPVQVIRQMSNIIRSVEDSPLIDFHAANMANEINAKAISTLTNSGYTAFQISAWRPQAHILVFTSNRRILTQLSLLWGVKAFYYDKFVSTDETIEDVNAIACKKGYLEVGDMLISLAAMPIQSKGMVNTLRVTEIESCSF